MLLNANYKFASMKFFKNIPKNTKTQIFVNVIVDTKWSMFGYLVSNRVYKKRVKDFLGFLFKWSS